MFRRLFLAALVSWPLALHAADQPENLLVDVNGDGAVTILAFGDSITAGVGDEEEQSGYPGRLQTMLKVGVHDGGVPGEELCGAGVERFVSSFNRANPDLVIMLEGANDARQPVDDDVYQRTVQRIINVVQASGRTMVLATLPEPCANHFFLEPYTPRYSSVIRALGALNGVQVIDFEHAFGTTCIDRNACQLYNLPEGLHPDALGYTAMAQTAAATLLGVNLFAEGGAAELEDKLGLPAGSVIVKPDPVKE